MQDTDVYDVFECCDGDFVFGLVRGIVSQARMACIEGFHLSKASPGITDHVISTIFVGFP